ncbi:hypothetical protein M1B34_28080 [Pseudomonas sp. MAFF 302030]|uniref:Uncharacterized protein n=1 Tax=Pseudomonas morbosilactucae TaxID=2938197 RepID=A0A9X1Z000_9PSED|nr:hypothetical protein [Pseudomonas morbosilactucae]MCK9801423.1 hypothetical protein [Pseudomonas morbosilactucae]
MRALRSGKVPALNWSFDMQWNRLVERTVWALWLLIFGGAALWVFVGSIGYFTKTGWLPKDVAAWVQAVGAIASIWAAFLIGNRQIREQNRIRREEQRARLLAFYSVVRNAAQNSLAFESLLTSDNSLAAVQENWQLMFSQMFKVSQRALSQLPSHELGNYDLVESFHSIAGSIDTLVAAVDSSLFSTAFQQQEFIFLRQNALIHCRVCRLGWERFEQACREQN